MSDYNSIVVGTDGSKSSLLAVERAAKIAAAFDSNLIIGCAYYENQEQASKTLRQDSVTILGDEKAEANLKDAPRSSVLLRSKPLFALVLRCRP